MPLGKRTAVEYAHMTRHMIAEARASARTDFHDEHHASRELSLVVTKLDEAIMWCDRDIEERIERANHLAFVPATHDHPETHSAAGGADGRDDHAS